MNLYFTAIGLGYVAGAIETYYMVFLSGFFGVMTGFLIKWIVIKPKYYHG